ARASAQQAAPALQHSCAPVQHVLFWLQQSLPWAQQPTFAGALQHALSLSLPQQASFFAQQSAAGAFSAAAPTPAKSKPQTTVKPPNSFVYMDSSSGKAFGNDNASGRAHAHPSQTPCRVVVRSDRGSRCRLTTPNAVEDLQGRGRREFLETLRDQNC